MTREQLDLIELNPDQATEYFVDLAKKYFNGKTPTEAITFFENISDDALDVYFEVFDAFIFRTEHEDSWIEHVNQKYNKSTLLCE